MIRDIHRALFFLLAGVFQFIFGCIILTNEQMRNEAAVFGVVMIIGGSFCLLAAPRGVRVLDRGLQVRSLFRRRFFQWSDVAYVGMTPVKSLLGETLQKPALTLRSGKVIVLPGLDCIAPFLPWRSRPLTALHTLEREVERRGHERFGR